MTRNNRNLPNISDDLKISNNHDYCKPSIGVTFYVCVKKHIQIDVYIIYPGSPRPNKEGS